MPNRNRRRSETENRRAAENQARRPLNPERRNEYGEEEASSRTEPRQLRTWDDLVAERQRQRAPQAQNIGVRNYGNQEANDNRSWADIVEEELYEASLNHTEQAGGHRLWADIMDDEMNHQVGHPNQIDMVLNENPEQHPIDLMIYESNEEEESIAPVIEDNEQNDLGSPVQAPANLVESNEGESDDNDFEIPIEWADEILDLEMEEDDDTSITSNPGRYHTKDNSEHLLSANISKAEMNLLPPPLLPTITHDLNVTIGEPQGSEVKPIHTLSAAKVEEEQKRDTYNPTKIPAVKEDVSRSREQRSRSTSQRKKITTIQEKIKKQLPGEIIYVQDLERAWQSAAFQKQATAKKDDPLLESPVKRPTAKKINDGKQKAQWSNLQPEENVVIDNKQFPMLGSTKYQHDAKCVHDKTKREKSKHVPEQPIAQAQAQSAQKKKSRKQWQTFEVMYNETSSEQQYPIRETRQQELSTWRKPYHEHRQNYPNPRDRQQNRESAHFTEERFGRPWAEGQQPTKSAPGSKAPRPFRVQRTRQGRTECPAHRSDYQQRHERDRNTQYETKRNYSRPEDSQRSQRGWDRNQQYQRYEERSDKRDDQHTHSSNVVSQAQRSNTKKDDNQVLYRNLQWRRSESSLGEDTTYPTLGSAKRTSTLGTYVSPGLKIQKSPGTTKDIHEREPQRQRTPVNVSMQQVSQRQVITIDCGIQTDEAFLSDQSIETIGSNVDNIYEDPEEIASDVSRPGEITIATGTKLSALSVEFIPKRTAEVVNLKLKYKDGTVVEDELIPEPVAPLKREDGSVDPTDALKYLHEKRKYFQARCRKLIMKHYPNINISSKRASETYEGMYNRLMEEEKQRLYSRMRTETRALSVSRQRTTEIVEQRPPSSSFKQRPREKREEIETDEQVTPAAKNKELVESEQVLYPERFWTNDEEANKILDEQEFKQIEWSTPKARKGSKPKKVENRDKETKVTSREKELLTYGQYSWHDYVEANRILDEQELQQIEWSTSTSQQKSKSKKAKSTDRQTEVSSSKKKQSSSLKQTRSVPNITTHNSGEKSRERKVKTEIVDKRQSEHVDKQNQGAVRKKSLVCRNLKAQFKQIRVDEHKEIKSKEVSDNEASAELSPPPRSKSNKRTKSNEKKTQEFCDPVSETAAVYKEEILSEPVPPTPMPDGSIDPEAQQRYQQKQHEYFEARCRLLIKKYYPTVDIYSKNAQEKYEDMFKRLLREETKLLAEQSKKAEMYLQKQKAAADQKMNKLIKDKVMLKTSPRSKTKSKSQKKKSISKAVPVPKPLELHADPEEKDSDEDATDALSTADEFISADDEYDTSSSNSPERNIQKQYNRRQNITIDSEDQSEPEAPVPFQMQMQANKASEDEDYDNIQEPDHSSSFLTPTKKQAQLEARKSKKSKQKRNRGKNKQRSDAPISSDEGDLHPKLRAVDDKHVQFIEKIKTHAHVDIEEKLSENYPQELSHPGENSDDYLQDEAAAFPLSELEWRMKKALSAGEEKVVTEDSEAKLRPAKSCPNLPDGEVKLTRSQRKRANAKKRALLAKEGQRDTVRETVVDEEPKPPVPDEYGLIDPRSQEKYEKQLFQAKCKRLILRDYPNVDINSKLANETYEKMYNRLLSQERLDADRRLQYELRKLKELQEKFNKSKLKKK